MHLPAALSLRRAAVEDAEILRVLNADVQRVHAALLPDLFKPAAAESFTANHARAMLMHPDNIVIIATCSGVPTGYAYAEARRRLENAFTYGVDEVYLHHLSVVPEYRRQGIGTALLDGVADAAHALGIERVALDVWTANKQALAFFVAHGFAPCNERLARQTPRATT